MNREAIIPEGMCVVEDMEFFGQRARSSTTWSYARFGFIFGGFVILISTLTVPIYGSTKIK